LAQNLAQPAAVSAPAPTNGATNRVTTMPSAPPEAVKVPIAAKR
jgi:hypothetical protein